MPSHYSPEAKNPEDGVQYILRVNSGDPLLAATHEPELRRLAEEAARLLGGVVASSSIKYPHPSAGVEDIEEPTAPQSEVSAPDRSLFNPEIQSKLNTTMEAALTDKVPTVRTRTALVSRLKWGELYTVRDVILGGEDYLRRIRGMGPKSISQVTAAVATACPEIPLDNRCEAAQAARFCGSLDEVPIYVLQSSKIGYGLFKQFFAANRSLSIADLLRKPASEFRALELTYGLVGLASAYAAAFEKAREEMAAN